ncbi:hypothetical protein Ahia01_000950900 [Argonauta hians]
MRATTGHMWSPFATLLLLICCTLLIERGFCRNNNNNNNNNHHNNNNNNHNNNHHHNNNNNHNNNINNNNNDDDNDNHNHNHKHQQQLQQQKHHQHRPHQQDPNQHSKQLQQQQLKQQHHPHHHHQHNINNNNNHHHQQQQHQQHHHSQHDRDDDGDADGGDAHNKGSVNPVNNNNKNNYKNNNKNKNNNSNKHNNYYNNNSDDYDDDNNNNNNNNNNNIINNKSYDEDEIHSDKGGLYTHHADLHTAMLKESMKVLLGPRPRYNGPPLSSISSISSLSSSSSSSSSSSFSSSSSSSSSSSPSSPFSVKYDRNYLTDSQEVTRPPRYMMELYERYRDGLLQKETFGNTVRSIHASIGEVNGDAMFFFNLSAIKKSEKVLRAEVHLYKRKSRPWMPNGSKLQIMLHEIGPNYISKTGRVTLHRASHGWQWRDVTNSVLSCLATSRKYPHLFAINFQTKKAGGKTRSIALKKFSIHHSRPFLIVYSNETEVVKLDQLDKLAERLKLFLPNQHRDKRPPNNHTVMSTKLGSATSGSDAFLPSLERHGNSSRLVHHIAPHGMGPNMRIVIDEVDPFHKHQHQHQHQQQHEVEVEVERQNTNNTQERRHKTDSAQRNQHKNKKELLQHRKYDQDLLPNKETLITASQSPDILDNNSTIEPELSNVTTDSSSDSDTENIEAVSVAFSDDSTVTADDLSTTNRSKRSVLTNEIPQEPVDYKTVTKYNMLNINPDLLQARQRAKQQKMSRLIPYPRDSQLKKKRRKRKKIRKEKAAQRRRLRFPKNWKNTDRKNFHNEDNLCKKHKLHVNLDDIGWRDWIISPQWLNAHYCAGKCPFPLAKKLRASNHATIQSIVHAIGIYPNVPAPCCVPDNVSSITLLYLDEDKNVILKNYPGMTVLSCACR